MSIPYENDPLVDQVDAEIEEIPAWQKVGKTMYRSLNAPLPYQATQQLYPGEMLSAAYLPDGSNIPHKDPEGVARMRMEQINNTNLSDKVQEEYAMYLAGIPEVKPSPFDLQPEGVTAENRAAADVLGLSSAISPSAPLFETPLFDDSNGNYIHSKKEGYDDIATSHKSAYDLRSVAIVFSIILAIMLIIFAIMMFVE